MKEHKTKRLVTAVTVFLGVLIVGYIFMKSPELAFVETPQQTIDFLMDSEYEVLPEDVAYNVEFGEPGFVYIDLRNPYEFAKGNIATSINIPQTDLLEKTTLKFFNETKKDSLMMILISYDEAAAIGPWLILKQLGYNNTKLMKGGWSYYANESLDPYDMPEVPKYMVEEPAYNFASIMEMMKSSPAAASQTDAPEIILPTRKKKKGAVEGGC